MNKKILGVSVLLFCVLGTLSVGFYKYPHRIPLVGHIPYFSFETHPESDTKAVQAIQTLRKTCATRYLIISAYRSPKKNKKVQGKSNSQHLRGRAFDVVVPFSLRESFYTCAKKSGFKGFGWGSTTVHVDLGPKRWWTYDNKGNAMSGAAKKKFIHKAPKNFRKEYGL